jgi:hypothetical protein
MPAWKFFQPPAALCGAGIELAEKTIEASGRDVSDIRYLITRAANPGRCFEGGQRLHRALTIDPGGVPRIHREGRRRERRHLPTVAMSRGQLSKAFAPIGHVVAKGFAVLGNEGIEINERAMTRSVRISN